MKYYIGLMSGTSMDGVDAALVDVEKNICLKGITRPYDKDVKQLLDDALTGKMVGAGHLSQLNTLIGRQFAKSVLQLISESQIGIHDIIAIGSHGQTLCHDTSPAIPYTVQLGCAHTIAEMTGITVIADFRTRDLVAGGQGAPFAPIYHQAVFKNTGFPLAVVNIGGIANLTWLPNEAEVSGYDIGPGNCLMDAWTDRHLNQSYDKDGQWASTGRVIEPLLNSLLSDPWFTRDYPKSIGKEYFSLGWLEKHFGGTYSANDVQATLLALTARTISASVNALPDKPGAVLLCGGGVHNRALVLALANLLPGISVRSTATCDVSPDFVEAMMFAWLAEKTLQNKPLDMKNITGSCYPVVLGAIYPAGRHWVI